MKQNRLVPGGLVTLGAFLLSTCGHDKIVDPPTGGILAVWPGWLADSAALGSRAVRVVSVTISNAAAGDLAWTAVRLRASPWLSLGAASGTAPGTLQAVADPTGLAAGVYEDTIVVTATSPARGEARIPIRFAIHACAVGPISLDVDVGGRLDGADCTAPHRDATFADLYSFTGSAGDSVSVELESDEFTPYLILDTTTTTSLPPLATSGSCAYAPGRPCLRYQRLPRSGTFVIEATTAVAGDSGAYRLRLFGPRVPSPVDSLTQLRGDSITPIVTGGMTADAAIVLRGTASDPDGGDSLRLEVEVRPVDEAFLGAATSTGALVPAGGRAVARVNGLSDNTAFHWRARVVDQTGRASAWTGYGDNPEFAADVGVAIADGPIAPAGLGQFKSDSLAAIAVGGMTDERAAVFKGTVLDPDPGDSARLDVEIQVVGTPFSGAPSASSALMASGGVGTVAITGLADNASYHWQARTVDQSGRASAWAEFGGNLDVAPDLQVHVAPTQLVFTVHPGTTGSGAAIAPAVQVAAQDGEGNTLASFTGPVSIALGSNAAGGTLSGTHTVNAVAGVATFADLWIDRAGSGYTLVASATGPAAATSDAFGITPGAAAQLAIMTQPSGTAPSGVAFSQQPVLQLLDAAGNAVSHDGVTVEAAIASGGGTLGGTTAVLTDASGVAAFTDLMITGPVGPRTLQFDATGFTGVSATVDLIVGPPSQMSIQAGDDQVDTVSQTLGTALAVRVVDQFDNPVSNVQITWAVLDGGGSVNPLSSLTDANGIATTSWTLGTATTPTDSVQLVQATGVGLPLTFTAFTVPGPVSASQTSVTAFPATITASSGSSASTLTITVRDQFGNVIKDKPVVLSATGTGNALTQPATTTDANGTATGTLSTTVAEGKIVSVTIDGTAVTQTAAVTVTPAGVSPAQSTVTAAPGTITSSSGASSTTITVTARDPFGNLIEGATVVFAATGTGNALTQPATTTDANGVATGSLSATEAGDKIVSATIGGTGITQTATVTVTSAGVSAAQSTVAAAPESITAGTEIATITVTARDPFGNPIEGATVVLAATGAGDALTQPATTTNASGVATGTLSSTGAGDKVISATIAGTAVTQTAVVSVTPAEVSAAQSTVAAAPGSISAGNGVATITVTARDPFGNPIEGATVVLAATGAGNTLTQPGTTTNGSGIATGALSATVAEAKIVSATINATAITQTAAVTVIPDQVSGTQSTVSAAPGSITAGSGVATITVTARDPFGNPIEGATVVLAATGTGNALMQPATTTDASGVATGSLSATEAGDKVVSATINATGITQIATVTVMAAAVDAALSTVAVAPGTITASTGASSAAITVTAKDQFGNPIEGAAVVLAATGSGNTVTQPAATTDANGVATGSLSATGAGDKIVAATIGGTGVTQTAVVSVLPAEVSAELSTVAAAPGSISAGNGVATITVTARDPFGNPIEGATAVLAATGDGNTLTQPGTTTNASGIATGALSATVAEPKVVSATINATAITKTAAVTVIPDAVSAEQSTVSAAPGSITAGSGVATITVTARDPSGNPIEGVSVVLAATGTGNTLTQPLGPTSASGIATGMLSATGAGGTIVSAAIAGVAVTQTTTVTVVAAGVDAVQSTVAATPETITAGSGVATITVTARDPFGNPIEGATVVLGATGSGNTLTQPASTNANGVATGTLSATTVEPKHVSATIGGTGVTQTAAVTVTPAGVSAEQSTIAAAPATIVASNGASSTTITVTARDPFGNPIEGATVVLGATGSGNTLTQPATTTDASGVATGTLSATGTGDKGVSATIGGTGITQTATVTVEATGVDAAQSTVAGAPGSITAGSGVATITVTARDAFGNPIQGATVSLAAIGSGSTLAQPATTTDASGQTTGTLSATGAGEKIVSATIAGTGATQTATVTVTAASVSAAQSTVTAAPGSITAGSGVATITVTARDAFGNPIDDATAALAATGSGNTLTRPASTNENGVTTGTLSAIVAEGKTVSVTIDGTAITQTATVTVEAAAVDAAQSTVVVAPTTITASNGTSSATITVTARDQFGNPIQGVTVVLAAIGSGNTLTQPATTTDASGQSTGTLSATAAGAKVVSATIAGTGVTQAAIVTVEAAGVDAAQSTVVAAPEAITASNGASSATFTVTARDPFGNPIEGVTVVLAATGTGNTLTQPGTTDASGIATGTVSATTAGDKVVSATIAGTVATHTATVTVIPAGVSAAQSTVTAAPGTITASNGGSSATITVTARDQFGNPIQGATVILAASGTANTLTQPATTTNANGAATGTLSATAGGSKVVSATISGTAVTQTATVTVIPAGVHAAQSTVAVSPGTITVGTGVATITVTARDQFGNPIQGVTVVLAATGSGNALTQPATTTDANGQATGTLSATVAEDKVVSASIAATAVTQTATVTVLPTSVSASQSTVLAAPTAITASGGASSTTITVTARDQFGNPIQGITVVLAATGSGNALTQPATTTDANGQATGALSATMTGDKVVSATIAGTGVTQTASVTVTPAGVSAAQSTVTASPGSITAGSGVATITVTARDEFGNPIQGAVVVLAATGTGNTLTQPGTTTDASGQATGALSATAAQPKIVSATIAGTGVTQTAIVAVDAAGADAVQSTVVAAPTTITASNGASNATITVTARDQFGNLIDGATVVLAVTGTGNILTQPGATNASGVATGTLSATVAEGKTVSVTIDGIGVTQTAAVTVTVANVSAAQSTVAAAPETITVGTGVATITVTARDAFGNPIEGATVELAVTGTGNTLTQPGATNADGVATGTLSATAAEDKVVSATIAGTGVTQTATVTVVSAGVSAAQSTVAASPASIIAGSGVAMITVTARDGFGNPVEGATVVLAATGSGNTLTQPGTTNASGVATGTLSATAAESKTVTATVDGLAIIQQATVLVTPAAAHHLVFLVQPTSATAGASMTPPVEVEIRDEFTNRVTDAANEVTLAIASNPAGGTLTGGGPAAAVGGVASFAGLSVDKAGTGYTLEASSLGLTGATSAAFSVMAGAVSPAQSTVAAAPESVGESELSTITVTARDPFGNPIQGATVTLAVTGSATLLTQPAAATAADGAATGTLSATLSGTKVVSAVINGTSIVQTVSVTVQPPPGSVVFVGAGDIADCETTTDEATATLLDAIPGTVFTAGDNAYHDGTATDFANCYEPTWGRHKARTRPSPGNHDYLTSGAAGYFAYFGPNAGPAGLGYYSYDLGDWHIISLNSEISKAVGSPQEVWLRTDLAANTKQCTLAYWHKPLFSSGEHGSLPGSKPLWKALQQYNAEVVVVGHDHNYERFAPQDSIGVADPANGLRQLVVGTGGTELRAMNTPIANSEVQNSDTHGVLRFTLHSTGYEWEFIPVAGKTFTDSGSGSCH